MTVTALPFEPPAPVKGKQRLYEFILDDAFNWLAAAEPRSVQAVVTDPPFGLVEFSSAQLRKRRDGTGGVWRLPPSFDGSHRQPVPRFTVLRERDKADMRAFFGRLSALLLPVLVPGATFSSRPIHSFPTWCSSRSLPPGLSRGGC